MMADDEMKSLLAGLLSELPREGVGDELAAVGLPDLDERIRRRALQLQTAAEVSSAVTSILELEQLLPQVVELIRERFDLYYVGIFLLDVADTDDGAQYAVLKAATGQAGRKMMGEGHKLQVGGDSMIGWCVANARARIALDVAGLQPGEEAARFDNPYLPETRSEMALPLVSRGQVIGAMTIQSARPAAFAEDDITVLQTMADQLANAIQNARLFQERERRITELAIVNEIGQAMSSVLTLDALLEVVHLQVSRLFDTTNFYIATYEEGSDLWTSAFHLEGGEQQPVAHYNVELGLTGHIIRQRTHLLFHNAEEIIAFHQERGAEILGEVARSWLGVPLLAADKLLGVMAIQSYESDNLYDEQDLALFSTIAAQVANTLENMHLLEETRRRAQNMAVINEVGQTITSVLDPDALLRQIVDTVKERFAHYFVGILLIEGDELVFRSGSLVGDSDFRWERGDLRLALDGYGLNVAAATSGQAILANDVSLDERYGTLEGLEPVRAELDTPITVKGTVIGTLTVQSDRVNAFDQTDVALLQTLANQAGVAIENARLFEETKQRAEEFGILHLASLELTQEAQDLDTVLDAIAKRSMDLLDSDGGGVWLWREQDQELELVITYQVGDVDFSSRRLKPGEGLTGKAFAERRIQVIEDYRTWAEKPSAFLDAPFVSGLAAPLLWQARVVGVLVLTRSQEHRPYLTSEQNLAELLAAQAAAVIQNARLFEQTQSQLSSLATIQAALAQLNAAFTFDEAIDVLLPQVASIGRADRVRMYVLDGEQMTCVGVHSSTGQDSVQVGETVSLDDFPLTKKVIETGQPSRVLADDPKLQPHAREAYKAAGLVANATIPLIGREEVVGVLSLNRKHPGRAFSEQDVSLVQTLANQATMVLEKSQLFEETQQRTAELQSLYETSLRMSTHLEAEELLGLIVEQAVTLLGAETAGFYLYEPQSDELVFSVAEGYFTEYAGRRLKPGEGLSGRVFQERQAMTVEDYQTWAGRAAIYEQEERLGTILAVPLLGRDAVLGVLDIGFGKDKTAFEERDIWLAELFAAQAATALENARLFGESQSRAEELAILNDMGRTLTAMLDVQSVIENIYHYTSQLMDTTSFYIARYTPATDHVSFPLAVEQGERVEWSSRQAGAGLTEYVIRSGEPLLIKENIPAKLEELGIEAIGGMALSWLGVPMRIGQEVIGIITVQTYETPRLYTEYHRDLLTSIANQAAVALESARLFEETQTHAEELVILNEMNQALATVRDLESMFENIYTHTSRLIDTTNFSIALYESEREELRFVFRVSESDIDKQLPTVFPADTGLSGYIIRNRTSLLVEEDVGQRMEELGIEQFGESALSWLGVPLMIGDRVLGVVAVQSFSTPQAYGEHDRDLLTAIASTAAISVENARLFQETQARAQRERLLREITTRVRGSTDPDTIMRTAVRELGTALGRPTFVHLGGAGELAPSPAARQGDGDGSDAAPRGGE